MSRTILKNGNGKCNAPTISGGLIGKIPSSFDRIHQNSPPSNHYRPRSFRGRFAWDHDRMARRSSFPGGSISPRLERTLISPSTFCLISSTVAPGKRDSRHISLLCRSKPKTQRSVMTMTGPPHFNPAFSRCPGPGRISHRRTRSGFSLTDSGTRVHISRSRREKQTPSESGKKSGH